MKVVPSSDQEDTFDVWLNVNECAGGYFKNISDALKYGLDELKFRRLKAN